MFAFGLGSRRLPGKGAAVLAAVVLGAGTMLAITPAAGAATTAAWSITPTPNPVGATIVGLNGVSCMSASACTAVGQYHNSAGHVVSLAERWNGAAWAIQPTPNPGGSNTSILDGVSCTSAVACTAVGAANPGGGFLGPLAERWNGTAWVIQATPSPTHGGELNGVSCTSASACTAVGQYFNSANTEFTLAERWNGTTWAVQPTPSPGGSFGLAHLDGVSCTSASSCKAVGWYDNSGGNAVPIAERWNGTTWALQSIPTIQAAFVPIAGVSCTSASSCIAVGSAGQLAGGNPPVPVAERWNGTTWAMQTIPNPTNGGTLAGVSCTVSGCTAVGIRLNSTGSNLTLAERWNGTAWAIQPTPNPRGSSNSLLLGVSCTSASACIAVGSGTGGTLAERYS